jgi:thiol-disulfide isomerase/thioredoxin
MSFRPEKMEIERQPSGFSNWSRLRTSWSLMLLIGVVAGFQNRAVCQDTSKAKLDPVAQTKQVAVDDDPDAPFQRRFDVPDFPKGVEWLNTRKPISKLDLKGKFVILDFWTYCCINCIHVLPELKKLEKKYPNRLVVIGVHSAKFENEKDTENIREAILRYEIEHPVINDFDHKVWDQFSARSWPSLRMLDPEGKLVAGHSGEIRFEDLDAFLKPVLDYYDKKGLLDKTPLRFELESAKEKPTPLRFPGKILADEKGKRLFITDSNHNRIVITDLDGKLMGTIGSGQIGNSDGDFDTAEFDHPQGTVLNGDLLYVCDTENHNLRKVDLVKKTVTTIAGSGRQAKRAFQHFNQEETGFSQWSGDPRKTELNSPWALWIHGTDLYIAMAGPHQIWKMPLDESTIGPFAGNAREDIVDGALLPSEPYGLGAASFAQPSGLASDGTWLYVADTEGSSIRAVPFEGNQPVKTVVGTAEQPSGRLFIFGDKDGQRKDVLLQHAIGIAYSDSRLFVADTYNNKIKIVNAKTGETRTLAGTGQPGSDDLPGTFDEPAGLAFANGTLYVADTNNHLIRKVDPKSGKVSTLTIEGLQPPIATPNTGRSKIHYPKASIAKVTGTARPEKGMVRFSVQLNWPDGWKTNELAPMGYYVHFPGDQGAVDRSQVSTEKIKLTSPSDQFDILLPVKADGQDKLRIEMPFFYCQTGDTGVCKFGQVAFEIDLTVSGSSKMDRVQLEFDVTD